MSKSKAKGTAFETAVRDYIADKTGNQDVHRTTLHGSKDMGDIGGVKLRGRQIVIECKNHANRDRISEWLTEAERERANANALAAVVVSHRRGYGLGHMGGQLVTMTLKDLVSMIGADDEQR